MAITPKYFSRASLPGGTGQAMAPLSLADTGAAQMGQMVTQAAGQIQAAGERIQRRTDNIKIERALDDFQRQQYEKYNQTLQTEELTDPDMLLRYRATLDGDIQSVLGQFSGSQEAYAQLEQRLRGSSRSLFGNMAQQVTTTQTNYINGKIGDQLGPLLEQARQDPTQLAALVDQGIEIVSRYEDNLRDDQSIDWVRKVQDQITLTAMQGYLRNNDWQSATRLREENQQIMDLLSPEARMDIEQDIDTLRQGEQQAFQKGQAARAFLRGALDREPTEDEVAIHIGTFAPSGEPAMTEFTQFQMMVERERQYYEEGTPQRAAFESWVAQTQSEMMNGAPADFGEVSNLRKEYMGLSRPFVDLRDRYTALASIIKDTSGSSDIAITYTFMKMLDPTSAIQQGEYATAENAGGIPEYIRNAYNKIVSGEFLSPKQRNDFFATAQNLMKAQNETQRQTNELYKGLAERNNLPVDDIVLLAPIELTPINVGTFTPQEGNAARTPTERQNNKRAFGNQPEQPDADEKGFYLGADGNFYPVE